MGYRRVTECQRCKAKLNRKVKHGRAALCPECSLNRAIEAARAMHNRAGEAWERWMMGAGPRGRPRTRPHPRS